MHTSPCTVPEQPYLFTNISLHCTKASASSRISASLVLFTYISPNYTQAASSWHALASIVNRLMHLCITQPSESHISASNVHRLCIFTFQPGFHYTQGAASSHMSARLSLYTGCCIFTHVSQAFTIHRVLHLHTCQPGFHYTQGAASSHMSARLSLYTGCCIFTYHNLFCIQANESVYMSASTAKQLLPLRIYLPLKVHSLLHIHTSQPRLHCSHATACSSQPRLYTRYCLF